jgi:hypothetical protein
MASVNEKVAIDILDLLSDASNGSIGRPLIDVDRPDYTAIENFRLVASTGERAMLDFACDAWRGRTFLSALDAVSRRQVVGILARAIESS